MCIIISRPSGVTLTKALYEECFHRNEHGAGFVVIDQDKLLVEKGFMSFEALWPALSRFDGREMVIHFRRTSLGMDTTPEMSHPFVVAEAESFKLEDGQPRFHFAITHNGRLDWRSTKEQSDTWCFVEDLLRPHLTSDPFLFSRATSRFMFSKTVKEGNKFVVMRWDALERQARVDIINEAGGVKALGCWFSNYSYQPLPSWFTGKDDGFYRNNGVRPEDYEPRKERHSYHGDFGGGQGWLFNPAIVDYLGWSWSYVKNAWTNANTQAEAVTLSHRPMRPGYMDARPDTKLNKADFQTVVTTTAHLSKGERRILCKLAVAWFGQAFASTSVVSLAGMLNLMRADVRTACPTLLTLVAIDDWLLGTDAMGRDIYKELERLKRISVALPGVAAPVGPVLPVVDDKGVVYLPEVAPTTRQDVISGQTEQPGSAWSHLD